MGKTIAAGAVRAGLFRPDEVLLFNRSEEKRAAHAAKGYAVTGDYTEVYAESEIVLLAVKPQNFDEILPNLAKYEGGEAACRIHCRRRDLRQAGGCTRRRHRDDPRDAEHTAYARRGCNPAG